MPQLSRRRFVQDSLALAGLGLLSGCGLRPRSWQPSARSAKIGVLSTLALDPSPEGTAFRAALRDLGYAEGRNVTLAFRNAGLPETLASAADELIDQGVDVIVTVDDEATRAARDASETIPVVMAEGMDPVGAGLIANLGRPGGHVTGLTSLAVALGPKRLELLRAAAPGISRVAFIWWARTGGLPDMRDLQTAAQAMGIHVVPIIDRSATDVSLSLAGLTEPVDGIILLSLASARSGAARIAASLDGMHLPAIFDAGSFVHAGGLMGYGASTPELFRRAATYVDKILKGARPADLPVEQPTKFDFVINLKTARALGLTIPPSVLQQATEIVQ